MCVCVCVCVCACVCIHGKQLIFTLRRHLLNVLNLCNNSCDITSYVQVTK